MGSGGEKGGDGSAGGGTCGGGCIGGGMVNGSAGGRGGGGDGAGLGRGGEGGGGAGPTSVPPPHAQHASSGKASTHLKRSHRNALTSATVSAAMPLASEKKSQPCHGSSRQKLLELDSEHRTTHMPWASLSSRWRLLSASAGSRSKHGSVYGTDGGRGGGGVRGGSTGRGVAGDGGAGVVRVPPPHAQHAACGSTLCHP